MKPEDSGTSPAAADATKNILRRLHQKTSQLPLRWRILIYLLGFSLIMVGLLWLFQIVYLDRFYESVKISQIEATAQTLRERVDDPDIIEQADEMAIDREICILVYRIEESDWQTQLTQVYSADVLADCLIHHQGIVVNYEFYKKTRNHDGVYQEIIPRNEFGAAEENASLRPFWDLLTVPANTSLADSLMYGMVVEGQDYKYFVLLNSA